MYAVYVAIALSVHVAIAHDGATKNDIHGEGDRVFTRGGNANGAPCVFPHTYRFQTYNQCHRGTGWNELWCCTVADCGWNAKKWGYCIHGEPGTKHNPGVSCKVLKENHPTLKSGLYWIMLTEPTVTQMFCEMDTSKGGWTLVGSATVATEAEATEVSFWNLISDDISRLSDVTKNRYLLSGSGLRDLQSYISFSHIRWFCHKPYHGRTLDISTASNKLGNEVVDYMLDRISYDNRPASCGSFTRLENDTSVLGHHCERWEGQKWDGCDAVNSKLYCFPMDISDGSVYHFYLAGLPNGDLCDDNYDHPKYSPVGEWMFYVK